MLAKRTFIIATVCFVAGLVLGTGSASFFGDVYSGKQIADGLALFKETEIAAAGERAFTAYQHESQPVAIYALSQYLDALKQAEEFASDNSIIMTRTTIRFDAMLTHARLAKVYAAAGQSDLSAQEIAEALKCAQQDRRLRTITNETALIEFVKRVDVNVAK